MNESAQWWAKDETPCLGLSLLPDSMLEKPGFDGKAELRLRSSLSLGLSVPGV